METQLAKSTSGYLVGDKCTIADIACWGWVAASGKSFVSLFTSLTS
jgi:glutathione S-transferase